MTSKKLRLVVSDLLHVHGLEPVLDELAMLAEAWDEDFVDHPSVREVSSMDGTQWQVVALLLRQIQKTVAEYEKVDLPY